MGEAIQKVMSIKTIPSSKNAIKVEAVDTKEESFNQVRSRHYLPPPEKPKKTVFSPQRR